MIRVLGSIAGIVCCAYVASQGFKGELSHFSAGVGWVGLVLWNAMNLIAVFTEN